MTKENDLKSVCLCGHRGDKLPRGIRLETLKHNITQEIQKAIDLGYTNFICMCGQGFDLISAQLLLDLKEHSFPHITLSAVIPHEEQARDWSEKDRNTYYDILEKCDLEILVCTKYMLSCYDVAWT